ncbi:MAG: AAA family ATPase [Thermomicrobiales bacterium]
MNTSPDQRPLMILLTGISFAGKSVLARALSQLLEMPIVDPDRVGHEMELGLNGEFLSDRQWRIIHAEAERRASESLRAGRSIVYDTTSFTAGQRAELVEVAESSGADALIVFVDTPREIAHARWMENNRSKTRFVVHEDDFNAVADAFERPTDRENHIAYAYDQDPTEWVRTHFRNAKIQ